MIILTSKYVLGVTAACVVGYVILLLPVVPELSRVPSWRQLPLYQALVKSWTLLDSSSTVVPSSTSNENPQESVVPEKRKRTLLEQKFAIDGPEVGWDTSTITLDYQLAEWVTNDVLEYALYDWDCQNKLDGSEPIGWKVMGPEKINLVRVDVGHSTGDDADGDSATEDAEMKMNHWRFALQPQPQQRMVEDDEHDSTVSSSSVATSFCIRFMLYNMPKHRQHAMEVTFRQTQLAIAIQEGYIQRVDISTPEPVAVQVKVNGRGRATVHRNEDNDDETAPQQNDENTHSGKSDDDNEEKQTGGMGETPSAPTMTTTTTDNDEL